MFKQMLSSQWDLLHPTLQHHYGIREGETITMRGELAVRHGRFIKPFMPLIRLTGALVPVEGDKFEVTVVNTRIGDTMVWHREFRKDNKCYTFKSKMEKHGNDVVEFVGLNIGIRMGLSVVDQQLVYKDKGYVLKIGKYLVPIPISLLVGKSEILEYVDDASSHDFNMRFVMTHGVLGFSFSYVGGLSYG